MKVLIVLGFEVSDPEQIPEIIKAINPPNLPGFTGTANIVVPPHTDELKKWLEE